MQFLCYNLSCAYVNMYNNYPAVVILEGTEGRSGVIYVKRNRKRERDFR